jgi:L-ascorbate metabolism protein UlaG (beta-lactamase superfamily)
MQLTWLGTAGFSLVTAQQSILIDPYLTRNQNAAPRQKLKAADIKKGDLIFISHGHFDHIYDVPEIATKTKAMVYCGERIDNTLVQKGLSKEQIRCVVSDGEIFKFDDWEAQAFFSKHVQFDKWLLIKTFARINFRLPRYLPLVREYPEGQVLSWRFIIEGKVIHHFGSGGSTVDELQRLGRQPTDILLVPMQGHTHITDIAHDYVKALQPKMVIPHHQDDFFPPISTMVNTQRLAKLVKQTNSETAIKILEMNETLDI